MRVRRVRSTRIVSGQVRSARHWEGQPAEETRQQYATRRIQEYQRTFAAEGMGWEDLLSAFRWAGHQYDTGTQVAA